MARANVDVVQAAFAAFLRDDWPALLELIARDIVVTQFPDQLDVRDYHGHEGVQSVMADWIGTWEDYSIELLSAREIGGLVLATAFQRGRGKSSGAPMEAEVAFVFTIRDGAIVRWQMFSSEREALEAIGRAEP